MTRNFIAQWSDARQIWNQLPTSLRIPHPNPPSKRPSFEHAGLTC